MPDTVVSGEPFTVVAFDPDAEYACIGVYQFCDGTCIGFTTRNGSGELAVVSHADVPAGTDLQLLIVARADTMLTTYVGMSYADVAAAFSGRPMVSREITVISGEIDADAYALQAEPVMSTPQAVRVPSAPEETMSSSIMTQTIVPATVPTQTIQTDNVTTITLTQEQEQSIIDQIVMQLKMLLGL